MATLHSVILEMIADENRNTLHDYLWYLAWAYQCLREFETDMPISVRTERLALGNRRDVPLPEDAVRIYRVGVMELGRIKPLLEATQGNRAYSMVSNTPTRERDFANYGYSYSFYDVPATYADGYAQGSWSVDEDCSRIHLSAFDGDHVWIEYGSKKFLPSCDAEIPEAFIAMVKAYKELMESKKSDRARRVGVSQATMVFQQKYERERLTAFSRISPIDPDSLANATRKVMPTQSI